MLLRVVYHDASKLDCNLNEVNAVSVWYMKRSYTIYDYIKQFKVVHNKRVFFVKYQQPVPKVWY